MGPTLKFFNLCLYALKFDMVMVYACIVDMGGCWDSNMTHINNSTIKRQNYNIYKCQGDEIIYYHLPVAGL